MKDTGTMILLIIPLLFTIFMIISLKSVKKKSQLHKVFLITFELLALWFSGLIAQILLSDRLHIDPIYFEYVIYIGACFVPVALIFIALIFTNTKIVLKRVHLLLFVIPIISLLVLWTNDFHHLFYKQYSVSMKYSEFGPYMAVHSVYSYALVFIACFLLIKYSLKNSGFFSKQSILIFMGSLTPTLISVAGYIGIIELNVYSTPISFTVGILCFAIAAFKMQFFNMTPIALQKVVDRMSDGYIVVNENKKVSDFNQTLLKMLKFKSDIRNADITEVLNAKDMFSDGSKDIEEAIDKTKQELGKTFTYDKYSKRAEKYFSIEISAIVTNKNFLGTLVLFKDTTQHVNDLQTITQNQETLMERERLASLGQLIGGIAHNLKTPIMSIAGAAEGISDLAKEYDESIEDPLVTPQDHHEIAKEMLEWVEKIKTHTEYMSDVITTVKGQAVALSNDKEISFTIEELVKRVNILMKHELKNAIIYLNVKLNVTGSLRLNGDVNSLVQVINNMISNSIQAYKGKKEQNIDLIINQEENNLIISIKDYAEGLPESVKNKLFKEMVTTKGKNGTGLGLFMSYSNIRAHFGGNITFESEKGKGTTFNIILPINY